MDDSIKLKVLELAARPDHLGTPTIKQIEARYEAMIALIAPELMTTETE